MAKELGDWVLEWRDLSADQKQRHLEKARARGGDAPSAKDPIEFYAWLLVRWRSVDDKDKPAYLDDVRKERAREDELLNSRLKLFISIAAGGLGVAALDKSAFYTTGVAFFELIVLVCWYRMGKRMKRQFWLLRDLEEALGEPYSWRSDVYKLQDGTPSANSTLLLNLPICLGIFFLVLTACTYLKGFWPTIIEHVPALDSISGAWR